jgi:hypothetical protein
MTQLRQHNPQQLPAQGDPPPGSARAERLDSLRQSGERFLAAGDEAIARALSGDSRAFLRETRQQGGQ